MPTAKQLANLIPQNKRTKSEQREVGKKGGKKSGETRKKLKTFREVLCNKLDEEDANGLTNREKITLELLKLAKNGNLKAIELSWYFAGEKPTEKIESENLVNLNPQNIDFKKLVEVNRKLNEFRNK